MSRQTAVPGIIVHSIRAKAGGAGRTLRLEEGLPEDVDGDRIQSFMSQIPLFGSRFVESKLVYTLDVAAYNKLSAKAKARAYVRMANPFSIDFIEVGTPRKQEDLGVLKGGRDAYRVEVEVRK